ncbi:stalk domain-containing protein [Paenibacillus sp. GCM10027628]|uniref:stalk domain-containing protein n=1 Tax=Paenibacillus sp. GCM10027628 TaxID=3273413 RepID=UPI00362F36DD
MRKIILLVAFMLVCTNIVSAAGVHGDFEGNPIVKITSNGKDVISDDVPAINYKNRTMVPIYLLSKIGATVVWKNDSYSVDVSLNNKADNMENLTDAYTWINDINNQVWMYAMKFNLYMNEDNAETYLQTINKGYQELVLTNNDVVDYVQQVKKEVIAANNLDEIISKQRSLINQASETKKLFEIWTNNKNDAQILKSLKLSIINLVSNAEQNVNDTNKIRHGLIKQNGKSQKSN